MLTLWDWELFEAADDSEDTVFASDTNGTYSMALGVVAGLLDFNTGGDTAGSFNKSLKFQFNLLLPGCGFRFIVVFLGFDFDLGFELEIGCSIFYCCRGIMCF